MIKRTESESTRRSKNLARSQKLRRQKRRLIMEGLENRQLLAADPIPVALPTVDPALFDPVEPRNIGDIQAFAYNESEAAIQAGGNDTIQTADVVPLGTLPGQQDAVDISGIMEVSFSSQGNQTADQDVFAFDLRAGDILDIALLGAVNQITVINPDGSFWFGTDENTALFHPDASPLMTFGNAVAAQVVPKTGRYYLQLAPSASTTQYTVGARVYRPVAESLPVGGQQYLYVDFDGGFFPTYIFATSTDLDPGIVRVPSLEQDLDLLGLTDPQPGDVDELIDKIIAQMERHFESVARNGGNGDYDSTGNAGDFGITILNSRDHVDPGFFHPLVTRVIVGGTVDDYGIDTIGIAESIDIGNFDMSEVGIVLVEDLLGIVEDYELSPTKSVLDALSYFTAGVISHEAGHLFGLRHTDNSNDVGSIIDQGGGNSIDYLVGVGDDGILGTTDDVVAEFTTDEFNNEGLLGFEFTAEALAYVLSTGTVGGSLSGRAFNDVNGDGRSVNDAGLSGVRVFADINGNGIKDLTDPESVTGIDGTYSLSVAAGTYDLIATAPAQFSATTPTVASVTVGSDGVADGPEFGFKQVIPDITGTKFADIDGNGAFDPDEPGIGGVYIYLDLDGDNRPDLGEPGDFTDADGTYSINFPGPGVYTIREVVEPGFIQTFPGPAVDGEHTVVFDGIALTENYDFGNLPSRDFGDAPDSYRTLLSAGGPSHGITAGLTIGSVVDRELDGQPTASATGDDDTGRVLQDGSIEDDEDGVRLLSPLGPGASADFEVAVTNTSGSPAFLQAWMDFNGNGSFEDPGEQFATDMELASGTYRLPVFVPSTAPVGTTYARLRYSHTKGLGVGGDADTGEVEDYSIPILDAAEIANDDTFSVSRNTQANVLDVLRNDFQTIDNQLTIVGRDLTGTLGVVTIAADGKSIFYTPPTGFIGRDEFGYTVEDEAGRFSTARVVVNVNFQSAVPIAVDDTFQVPEGAVNFPLNVLDNDVPSIAGGLSITSVTSGNQGGQLNIVGGGQSIRYTPLPGFRGTEQFTYSVQDAAGSISMAQVTVNMLPGSQQDDVVDFSIGIYDVLNDREISSVKVGDIFNVRVFVDDLRNVSLGIAEGVASAFLDLLYTDELVASRDSEPGPPSFDVSFGPLFSGGGTFQQGNALTPGLFDEIGGVQPILNQTEHSGAVELLTVTMQAVSPGVAIFQADPADAVQSETVILDEDTALDVSELRLGNAELTILPSSAIFTSAVDDSFPDGRDSDGNLIIANASTAARLDVLANDNFGATGTIAEFGFATPPRLGNATINENGTPDFYGDDFIEYFADQGASGLDEFTYLIRSADGIVSTAEVTIAVGNAGDDDLVAISFGLVNSDGSPNPSGTVSFGDRIGVQVIVEDLRQGLNATYVFAGFLDVLFDSGILSPTTTISTDGFDDFDVVFESDFNPAAAVGSAAVDGIIDEFGTLLNQSIAESGNVDNPNLMATLFFSVVGTGTTSVVGGPADASPFQDTLLFREDDPVPVDRIRYDVLNITVGGGEGEVLHNTQMPGDVNNDGSVSPIDALLVINHLGREDVGEGERAFSVQKFYDVSGDGRASSLDALLVINTLSRNRAASESELIVGDLSQPTETARDSVGEADAVFAQLTDSRLVGDAAVQDNLAAAPAISPVEVSGDSDDDDDDILLLLADDVSGLWN